MNNSSTWARKRSPDREPKGQKSVEEVEKSRRKLTASHKPTTSTASAAREYGEIGSPRPIVAPLPTLPQR